MSAGAQGMGIRIAAGVTVVVPPQPNLMTPYVLLEQEDWFEDEIAFLVKRTATGERVVDVGANYGLYSLSLAAAVGPAGRVWSVEPASRTAAYLRESIAVNGLAQVTVIQAALSDREGSAKLSVEGNSELNSLSAGRAGGATEEVRLSTLDSLAREHNWEGVDFLKLDAEGEEERIIAGGTRFLASGDPMVMFEIRHGSRANRALAGRLADKGYQSYQLVPGLGLLVPFDPAEEPDPYRLNLFACKPGRAAALERRGALARETTIVGHLDPMAHYRAAQDERAAPAERYAHLLAAHAGARASWASGDDPYTLGTCARIARELGHRQQAIGLLERALEAYRLRKPGPARVPFLPANAGFDRIDPGGRNAEWLEASLLDALVTLSGFSTYFALQTPLAQQTLDRLESIKASGFQRAPMERRRQLLRIVCGLQPGPEPAAVLASPCADHLNPKLWAGG